MPGNLKVLRVEGQAPSLLEIGQFLDRAPGNTNAYSLRACTAAKSGCGKAGHDLFLRDGSESLFTRFYNWVYAKEQRLAAKQLISAAIRSSSPHQGPDLARDRALLQIHGMKRLAPEKIRRVLAEFHARARETGNLPSLSCAITDEERSLFSAFNEQCADGLQKLLSSPFPESEPAGNNDIERMLADARWHWRQSLLRHFMNFSALIAQDKPLGGIDFGMVAQFCIEWETYSAAGAEAPPCRIFGALPTGAREMTGKLVQRCRQAARTACNQPMVRRAPACAPATVPAQSGSLPDQPRRQAGADRPAVRAAVFGSLWACRAGRHAMAACAASRMLARPAQAAVKAAGESASASSAEMLMLNSRAPEAKILRIGQARTPQDIGCDWQSELDLSGIDGEAILLVRSAAGPFSMSPQCESWLAGLHRLQARREGHYSRVHEGTRTVLLAQHQARPMNHPLSARQVAKLGKIYGAAIDQAVGEGKPVCLTELFDHDQATVDQCVEAMLAPLRKWFGAGIRPAVHIRVTSLPLQRKIAAALQSLVQAPPSFERPFVEVVDALTEIDVRLPGMMMVTAHSSGFATGPLRKILSRLYAQSRKSQADKVIVRNSLGQNNGAHLYFFADRCPLKNKRPDGPGLAQAYAEFFAAAARHGCELVSIEVLSESAGQEGLLVAALSAAILAAQARTPALRVRVLTANAAIRDGISAQFREV